MEKRSRIILTIASLALVIAYFTPLWRITLEAPQYPEGLGLRIMLNTVVGAGPHDLNNINNLNHYIGMKRIEPDAIPELKIMPWAIGFVIVFGLMAAGTGSRTLLAAWTGIFVVLAIAGLVDFWLWEYDYGHNLDLENAAIQVPGMSYQPPLIGWKQLLNFKAHSWPDIGGWVIMLSAATGVLLTWFTFRKPRSVLARSVAVVALLLLAGCEPAPEPFVFGSDQDTFCRMTITDDRFAGQLVLSTGKVLKFDSIECMANYAAAGLTPAEDVHSTWISLFNEPGALVRIEEVDILYSAGISSPMGAGLAAIRKGGSISTLDPEPVRLTWDAALVRVASGRSNSTGQ